MKKLTFLFLLLSHFLQAQDKQVWMHPNRGQWHGNIRYKVELTNGQFFIEQNAFTFQFHNVGDLMHSHSGEHSENHPEKVPDKYRQHVIKSVFLRSNPEHAVKEGKFSEFYRNYFLGRDQSTWKSDVYSCSRLSYPGFYEDIDLLFESGENSFKYSFILQPGADAGVIRYRVDGADKLSILKNGSLEIRHSLGAFTESRPVAWTVDANGNKTSVKANYKLDGNIVSFEFPEGYNTEEELVIDPELTFSTYTGSLADNWGCTATPDNSGNLYAGGTVFSPGYPVTPGAYEGAFNGGESPANQDTQGFDVSLSKFNSNGTALMYSTYIGGTKNEAPNSMVTNAAGELYIMGVTSSEDFTSTGNGFSNEHNGGSTITLESNQSFSGTDIFVIKISASGNAVLNSTFMGGSNNDGINLGNSQFPDDLVFNYGDTYRGEIILDLQGNVLVASSTRSGDFPTLNASQGALLGSQDAVLFKLNPTLNTLLWSTYYGGSGMDCGNALALNSANQVYIAGGTNSSNLQVPGGHAGIFAGGQSDGYVTRFNAQTGALMTGTYIGTSVTDQSFFVQVDPSDFVYVYGQSAGTMPISPGVTGNPDARQFIRKFNQNLSSVAWNTKIGGSDERISPTAFLVSNCYEIYFAGWGGQGLGTDISGFPTTSDAFQPSSDGDAFYIAVLNPDAASIQYATFMGGPAADHVDGGTSRFDKRGNIYHAVCSACGGMNNGFVSTPGAYSTTNNSDNCNLAAFKFRLNTIDVTIANPSFLVCLPDAMVFLNASAGGDTYFWDFGDGTFSNEMSPNHLYTEVGVYTVKLIVSDSQGCLDPDSTTFEVSVGSYQPGTVVTPPVICRGVPYQLEAAGGVTFKWTPANVLDDPASATPIATVYETTNFTVIIIDSCNVDTLEVTLAVFEDSISVTPDTSICITNDVQIGVTGSVSRFWTPNEFINNNTLANPVVSPEEDTYYVVTATTANNCVLKDSVFVDVFLNVPEPNLEDTALLCNGSSVELVVSGASYYRWTPDLYINTTSGSTVVVSPPEDMMYYGEFINACGSAIDSIFINVVTARVIASNDTIICLGDTAYLNASGVEYYSWSPSKWLSSTNSPEVFTVPQGNVEYRVIGVDENGCRDTAEVFVELYPTHPVDAGSNVSASFGDVVQLNAVSNTTGSFFWSPALYLTCTTCPDPQATPDFNFSYTVFFTDTNGCVTKDFVNIFYQGLLYIPNTFTPDGSRHNEVFKAYGEGIESFEMLIFNRWGELIYTMDSMDDYWDGRYKGKLCQDGTYTWKVTYSDNSGEFKTITGHINLLK
ncbi:MAG: hypothetical protein K0R65_2563 [Crocinitomicaceae bacterium]|jgi:gliding motility-associated-like protein|nr:hypothetical protein [Crocinitomicaceae bacterium]